MWFWIWIWFKPVKPVGKPVKPAGIPVQTDYTCDFKFGFEFNRFPHVSGQTGPVNRYRRAAVWPDRSGLLPLVVHRAGLGRLSPACCRVGFRFLGTVGTLCHTVSARQVNYQAQTRLMARRYISVPCRPKHGPPNTCNRIYMYRCRNVTITIRKPINYRW
jgi:hypothetical protein